MQPLAAAEAIPGAGAYRGLMETEPEFRVLIAGGGVAALEAVLALAALAPSRLSVEVVCPESEFSLRPLSVARPFGMAPPHGLDLAEFCSTHGAGLRRDRLAEVWGGQRRVLLDSGEEVFYDALLLAFGAQPVGTLPGSRPFRGSMDSPWFEELLGELERGEINRLAFAVPTEVRWSMPLYELALMTAHHLRERGVDGVEITFVTHETTPLAILAPEVGRRLSALLSDAGIELLTGLAPDRFTDELLMENGRVVAADRVVSLPELRAPSIPGLPGGALGLLATDAEMRVAGLDCVWAAGDATWIPIKQGGLAAQQADVAAASIAATAGLPVEVPAFAPVIRASLLTGEATQYIRGGPGEGVSEISASPLWWPPGKVAGKRLAPYLARLWAGEPSDRLVPLEDLDRPTGDAEVASAEEHRAAVQLALTWADADAAEGELRQALRWLDVAERLDLTLPREYGDRRAEWERAIAESA